MGNIENATNRQTVETIRRFERNPEIARPVNFCFVSHIYDNIRRLSDKLNENGYYVVHCGVTATGVYKCTVVKKMVPDYELLNRICIELRLLAERFGVEFEGWEVGIGDEGDSG